MRPKIILNCAASADGKIALPNRRNLKLSNEQDFESGKVPRLEVKKLKLPENFNVERDRIQCIPFRETPSRKMAEVSPKKQFTGAITPQAVLIAMDFEAVTFVRDPLPHF